MTGRWIVAGAAALLLADTAMAADMNISQFVFRDTNRNGIYEKGEAAFAGVPVNARLSMFTSAKAHSNLSGFANFAMSADEADKDITKEGEWEFAVDIPDGFELTTGNPSQSTTITMRAGTPGGMVADPPLPFMGLAPTLTIEAGTFTAERLTCEQDGAVVEARETEALKLFTCDVTPGRWTVTWHREGGSTVDRLVEVTDWPVRVPFPFLTPAPPETPHETVTFDDIIYSMNIQEMASGFGGVHWHNMIAVHRKYYGGWGYVNSTISGAFGAYNSSGHPARLYYDEPFDFLGTFVGVAWPDGEKAPVRIQAFRDGKVVADDAFFASIRRPLWFDAGWQEVDEVRISHEAFWQVVIDDLRVGAPETTSN